MKSMLTSKIKVTIISKTIATAITTITRTVTLTITTPIAQEEDLYPAELWRVTITRLVPSVSSVVRSVKITIIWGDTSSLITTRSSIKSCLTSNLTPVLTVIVLCVADKPWSDTMPFSTKKYSIWRKSHQISLLDLETKNLP